MTTQTILIVEDEEAIARKVQLYFERGGFRVLSAADGLTGLALARSQTPDLIVLDLMLPGMDGLEVCAQLRAEGNPVPIIMLTALGGEADRIEGLEAGADDYVPKPFFAKELVARARAVLRRVQGVQGVAKSADISPSPALLTAGEIRLNPAAHECTIAGTPVHLSRSQIALLTVLMRHPGQVFSRDQLLDALFQESFDGMDRSIDIHISRLRQKIEADPANPRHILTIYGVGYKFER